MGASDLIGRLALAGVKLWVDGANLCAEPAAALTDDLRTLIRANKAAILEALTPVERGQDLRRQKVLRKLAAEPDKQRVAIFDPNCAPDAVICTVAIRGVGTFEMQIPKDRYDPFLVLDVLSRSGEQ
jgi:hypothetical protein